MSFKKKWRPLLFSYTEELYQKQQSTFLNLLVKPGNKPKLYNENREINKQRDRLDLLSFEISAIKWVYKNNPLKTKDEVNEFYKKAVQNHMENKNAAAHPLDSSIFNLLKGLKHQNGGPVFK
jgi:hypothetical protein